MLLLDTTRPHIPPRQRNFGALADVPAWWIPSENRPFSSCGTVVLHISLNTGRIWAIQIFAGSYDPGECEYPVWSDRHKCDLELLALQVGRRDPPAPRPRKTDFSPTRTCQKRVRTSQTRSPHTELIFRNRQRSFGRFWTGLNEHLPESRPNRSFLHVLSTQLCVRSISAIPSLELVVPPSILDILS